MTNNIPVHYIPAFLLWCQHAFILNNLYKKLISSSRYSYWLYVVDYVSFKCRSTAEVICPPPPYQFMHILSNDDSSDVTVQKMLLQHVILWNPLTQFSLFSAASMMVKMQVILHDYCKMLTKSFFLLFVCKHVHLIIKLYQLILGYYNSFLNKSLFHNLFSYTGQLSLVYFQGL